MERHILNSNNSVMFNTESDLETERVKEEEKKEVEATNALQNLREKVRKRNIMVRSHHTMCTIRGPVKKFKNGYKT